jgi:16S rRNA (guanine966-N2)-methyltransferase
MLRKAVFDILQSHIQEATFLDLFAGSGAMGIEALSRGASHTTFVETDRSALKAIYHNLKTLELEKNATVYAVPVEAIVKRLTKEQKVFDLIYADPPYHRTAVYEELLKEIDGSDVLSPGGLLFLESLFPSPIKDELLGLKRLVFIDERRFGTSLLRQYRHR